MINDAVFIYDLVCGNALRLNHKIFHIHSQEVGNTLWKIIWRTRRRLLYEMLSDSPEFSSAVYKLPKGNQPHAVARLGIHFFRRSFKSYFCITFYSEKFFKICIDIVNCRMIMIIKN